jgi:hypothetical protein
MAYKQFQDVDSFNEGAGYTDDFIRQIKDPTTDALTAHLSALNPSGRQRIETASDTSYSEALYRHGVGSNIRTGLVLFALPYQHHYKVQVDGGPVTKAIKVESTGILPLGARSSGIIPVGSSVILLWPENAPVPYIIGTLPHSVADDRKNLAAVMQQGGNSTVLSQLFYRQMPGLLALDGQIQNYGCGRPLDGLNYEYSISTDISPSFLIDSYQIALSISEACGLFCNWFDNHTRLAGFGLDIQSYAEHVMQRYDEGENISFRGGLIYPWESTGNYKYGEDFTKEREVEEYQLSKETPYGHIDLDEEDQDLVPIYRCMEYGGYLGQGITRMLMKPAKEEGKRHAKDEDIDYGLWHETIALDGSYTMRSAKSVFIGKYALIPIPKRLRMPEDWKEGDDAREDNYKFSSEFGSSEDHKVKDFEISGEDKHLLRAAGVLDLLTYNYNWKGTHPFYYHKKDYNFPEESKLSDIKKAQEKLSYGSLATDSYLDEPNSKKLKIDDRYKKVEYFQSMAYITMLEDGGVLIGDGYGSQITMTGGQIRLEAPGEVMIMPGTRAVTLCDEFLVRAKSNIELSSSEKDVRLKAERNMQLLSGNDGKGGMLIENKAEKSWKHKYKEKYGDEVVDSGITLLAKDSGVGAVGNDIYIRSNASGGSGGGQITLDGGQGRDNIVMYAKAFHIFESEGMTLWEGPEGENPDEMKETHRFHSSATMHSSPLLVEGNIVTTKPDSSITTAGSIYAKENILCRGILGHYNPPFVADLRNSDEDLGTKIDEITKGAQDGIDNVVGMGKTSFTQLDELYGDNKIGNSEFLNNTMGFSFNDKPKGKPYGYSANTFKLPETRWQQWTNLGIASGGSGWKEKSVKYQGAESYPWPGKKNWVEGTNYKRIKKLNLFDASQGRAIDREGGEYEEPKLEDFDSKIADSNYTLIGGS